MRFFRSPDCFLSHQKLTSSVSRWWGHSTVDDVFSNFQSPRYRVIIWRYHFTIWNCPSCVWILDIFCIERNVHKSDALVYVKFKLFVARILNTIQSNLHHLSILRTIPTQQRKNFVWKGIFTNILKRKYNDLFKRMYSSSEKIIRDWNWHGQKNWERRNSDVLLSINSINIFNHRDWSYIKRISGHTKLKEKTIAYLENWIRRTESIQEHHVRD